jgi:signal transduction histidine kinase
MAGFYNKIEGHDEIAAAASSMSVIKTLSMLRPSLVSTAGTLVPGLTFFEAIKEYVEFDDTATACLRSFHPLAEREFARIIDDFYQAIQSHPGASAAITGGAAQIARLKRTLVSWMHDLLQGPHDEAYFEKRARIGRVHVRIGLPQPYMLTAMNRIRVQLAQVAHDRLSGDPPRRDATTRAMHQIMDLELAIMLETYRDDLLAKNRTAERLATIGEFAAGIGHELRNPLGVIESSVYLLRQHLAKDPTDPRIARHLDKITAEVFRATTTITELLELARNRAPHRQPTGVRHLVAAAISATPLPVGVEVETVTAPEADILLDVDRDQLVRVLCNLFINAAQAMNGEGRIVVGASRSGNTTNLCVRDTGPGISPQVRPRIFEALFTTRSKGTGLGLALCRRIVEAHGGTIGLDTSVELDVSAAASSRQGACFIIAIPDGERFDGPG